MKKLIYVASFTDASGYANAARKYLNLLDKHLDKERYELKIYNCSYEKGIYCNKKELEIINKYLLNDQEVEEYTKNNTYNSLFHILPSNIFLFEEIPKNKTKLIYNNSQKKINFSYWEADRLPSIWRELFSRKSYDALLVGSAWNKRVYEKDARIPVKVIPTPMEATQVNKINNNTFDIFSMSQWNYRKGFDLLIKAFYQEFFDNSDVNLTIKTYREETSSKDTEKEKNIILNGALYYKSSIIHYNLEPKCEVKIICDFIPREEIENLYCSADVFCMPTRGEGFGLTIADASLRGIPCIVPDVGGHTDFLDKKNNFFIETSLKPVENMPSSLLFSSREMNFLEPDINSLKKQMRKAYNIWKNENDRYNAISDKSLKFSSNFFNEKKIFHDFVENTFNL
jgi:glycosyltransferase involved in cell wall biosynthesis